MLSTKHIDGLVQERRNSSVLAMELRISCINPSIWSTPSKTYTWDNLQFNLQLEEVLCVSDICL